MTAEQIKELLPTLAPATPEGADLLLDLRELLLREGHPGKCVQCFFGLLGDLRQPGVLSPLRHWLESRIELEVSADGREIDVLPVQLGRAKDIENYCREVIGVLRNDRVFTAKNIAVRFRFKNSAVA